MNTRNGKIARLPRAVREELNKRLEESAESPELLAWLNGLPEVRVVLEKHFGGAPINKMNLSRWRNGGFQEALARRDIFGEARAVAELAEELDGEEVPRLADNVATVLSAHFASLLSRWNGVVDPKFKARAGALNRLCGSVVRLQRQQRGSKGVFGVTVGNAG